MKRRLQFSPQLLVLLLLCSCAVPATAQNKSDKKTQDNRKSIVIDKNVDGERESVKIEIENGRTRVNGVEVPEGEDLNDYLPEGFGSMIVDGHDGPSVMVFRNGDGPEHKVWMDDNLKSGHLFRDDPDANSWSVRGPAGTLHLSGDARFGEMRDELSELGGDWGSRAVSFFSDMGGSPTSPEVVQMEVESRRLARQITLAESDEKTALSTKLDSVLQQVFDAKTEIREKRAENLRSRLAEEEDVISTRKRNRQEMIEDRKSELLGRNKKYDW